MSTDTAILDWVPPGHENREIPTSLHTFLANPRPQFVQVLFEYSRPFSGIEWNSVYLASKSLRYTSNLTNNDATLAIFQFSFVNLSRKRKVGQASLVFSEFPSSAYSGENKDKKEIRGTARKPLNKRNTPFYKRTVANIFENLQQMFCKSSANFLRLL